MRIAFDIGGVLSKRPEVFIPLVNTLCHSGVDVYLITDMDHDRAMDMLRRNGLVGRDRVVSVAADYELHGELCKAKACEVLGIDLLIDDHPGYVATGDHVRLLVMPDPERPYYADTWKTDGSEGSFGRSQKHKEKTK